MSKPADSTKNISIVGCQMLNESILKAQIDSAFQGNEEHIAERIREFVEQNHIVDRVIVKEEHFNDIVVEIHERKPVATVTSASGKVLVDRLGKPISNEIRGAMKTLPKIVLSEEGNVSKKSSQRDTKLLATLLHELHTQHRQIYDVISEVVQYRSSSWMIYRCDFQHPIIVAPTKKNIHSLVNTLSLLQSSPHGDESETDIEYIDLRFENQVIYGKNQESVVNSPRRS